MSALTDVFRNAAKRYHESFPTAGERRAFIATARKALTYSNAFNLLNLPDRKRRALLSGPVETDAQVKEILYMLALVQADVSQQVQSYSDEAKPIPAHLQQLDTMLSFISKGRDPDIRKDELGSIRGDLHDVYNAATAAKFSKQSKINNQKTGDDAKYVRIRRRAAEILDSIKDRDLSQSRRAHYVLQKLDPRDRKGPRGQTWTPSAFIKWTHNHKLPIEGRKGAGSPPR